MKDPALKPVKATKAQVEALRWLVENGNTRRIPASGLTGWYEERAKTEHEAGTREYGFRPNTSRMHAWRRTSGRVMNAMTKSGLMVLSGFGPHGAIFYTITDAGLEVARA